MRVLAHVFNVIYRYVTAFIVVASPLFFIPGTSLTPEATYYLVVIAAIALALLSYILSALLTRSWKSVTRFEIVSYILFAAAVLLSAVFARDPHAIIFGNQVNQFSALSLLSLPAVVYLVRTLPDDFRRKLKKILVLVLAIATFFFLFTFIFQGSVATALAAAFGGFSSTLSLAFYLGLFVVAAIALLRKTRIDNKYKTAIGITVIILTSLLLSLASNGEARPNLTSSMIVAKETLMHQGVFGIGAGDFSRAWQLYRPQTVIDSPYFDVEFAQGSGTIPTFFTTIGIFGAIIFIVFMLGSLYLTFLAYRRDQNEDDKHISGLLILMQIYFFVAAWIVPISFAVLVLWMVLIGLSLARLPLDERHPHRTMLLVMIPILVLLGMNVVTTFNKTRAFITFSKAQALVTKGDFEGASAVIDKAISQYPMDALYRAKLENAINSARKIIAEQQTDQEALKTKYLAEAQKGVDAGLMAVTLNPYNYQNYVSLGRAYELALPFDKTGAYDRASKSYQEAIKLYPDNPYLYVMMARLEAVGGSKEGVRQQLTEALRKKQNFADALYLMSQLEASEQKIDEALNYAIEAVKNAPNDPATYVQAGLLYYGKKDYQNAVVALQKALEMDPTNNNIAYFLALSFRDGGRPDLAAQIGQELLRRNPGNADLTAFLKSLEPAKTGTKAK